MATINKDFLKLGVTITRCDKCERVEVAHGQWEEYQVPHIICCSECDWGTGIENKTEYNFCPNCGAKMDAEVE